jgi:hypothetical protein
VRSPSPRTVAAVGDRADLVARRRDSLVSELSDGLAFVVARLGPFAIPESPADDSDGQRVPTLPSAGS